MILDQYIDKIMKVILFKFTKSEIVRAYEKWKCSTLGKCSLGLLGSMHDSMTSVDKIIKVIPFRLTKSENVLHSVSVRSGYPARCMILDQYW